MIREKFNQSFARVACLVLIGLSLADLTGFLVSSTWPDSLGMGLWVCANILLVAASITTLTNLKNSSGMLAVIVLLISASIICISILYSIRQGNEITQEVSCALQRLRDPGFGFKTTCFVGYPTRGYYVTALPSLIFERNPITLVSGNAFMMLIGFIFFVCGIYSLTRSWYGALAALFSTILLFHIPYFITLAPHFEQTMMPMVFSLMLTGLILKSNCKTISLNVWICGIVAYLCSFSYTPALSLSTLATVLFLLFSVVDKNRRIQWATIAVTTALSILGSLLYRHDLRYSVNEPMSAKRLWVLIQELVVSYDFLVSPLLIILIGNIFFLTVVLHIYGWDRKKTFLGALIFTWAGTTILCSVIMPGYARPPVHFALHRSMIIVPPILAYGVWLLGIVAHKKRWVNICLIGLIFLSAFQAYQRVKELTPQLSQHWTFLRELNEHKLWNEPISILFHPKLKDQYLSLHDASQYFMPNLAYAFLPSPERKLNTSNLWFATPIEKPKVDVEQDKYLIVLRESEILLRKVAPRLSEQIKAEMAEPQTYELK